MLFGGGALSLWAFAESPRCSWAVGVPARVTRAQPVQQPARRRGPRRRRPRRRALRPSKRSAPAQARAAGPRQVRRPGGDGLHRQRRPQEIRLWVCQRLDGRLDQGRRFPRWLRDRPPCRNPVRRASATNTGPLGEKFARYGGVIHCDHVDNGAGDPQAQLDADSAGIWGYYGHGIITGSHRPPGTAAGPAIPGGTLTKAVARELGRDGVQPNSVTCPALARKRGATATCKIHGSDPSVGRGRCKGRRKSPFRIGPAFAR